MARQQTASKTLYAIAGAILLPVGLLLLLANLDEAAARAGNFSNSTAGPLGTVIELGLAGLRAAQTYFFDPSSFQAGLHQILISFWPLIVVIIGAALLHRALGSGFGNARLARTLPLGKYENEP